MVRCASLFSRVQFYQMAVKYGAECCCKGFSFWDYFLAMLFCRLAQAKSLRDIRGGLACTMEKLRHLGMKEPPNKSALCCANAHRSWEMFHDLFYETVNKCKVAAPTNRKFRFKNKLLSLNSTGIVLCLALFPWAEFRRTKGAVKLHLLLDHESYFPTYAYISNCKKDDVTIAGKVPLPPVPSSRWTEDTMTTNYSLPGLRKAFSLSLE